MAESCGERRRKGNGLLEMVSGRGEERTDNREKGCWYYLYIHIRAYVGEEEEGEGGGEKERERSEKGYAATIRTDRKSAGALVRISNTDRIQGISLNQCPCLNPG